MKALRLPIAYQRSLIGFASAAHAIHPVSCSPQRSRKAGRSFQARAVWVPAARRSGCSRADANGISQVFRRSFPCLCSAPGPRSNRRGLAVVGHFGAAPAGWTAKASATPDFGANTQLRHPLTYAHVAVHVQGSLPAGRLTFAGRELNPQDRVGRFQFVLTFIPLPCSPDATILRTCKLQCCSFCADWSSWRRAAKWAPWTSGLNSDHGCACSSTNGTSLNISLR
jgi:hypothetical protein